MRGTGARVHGPSVPSHPGAVDPGGRRRRQGGGAPAGPGRAAARHTPAGGRRRRPAALAPPPHPALPTTDGPPFPLAVITGGFLVGRGAYAALAAHLASWGFAALVYDRGGVSAF